MQSYVIARAKALLLNRICRSCLFYHPEDRRSYLGGDADCWLAHMEPNRSKYTKPDEFCTKWQSNPFKKHRYTRHNILR